MLDREQIKAQLGIGAVNSGAYAGGWLEATGEDLVSYDPTTTEAIISRGPTSQAPGRGSPSEGLRIPQSLGLPSARLASVSRLMRVDSVAGIWPDRTHRS